LVPIYLTLTVLYYNTLSTLQFYLYFVLETIISTVQNQYYSMALFYYCTVLYCILIGRDRYLFWTMKVLKPVHWNSYLYNSVYYKTLALYYRLLQYTFWPFVNYGTVLNFEQCKTLFYCKENCKLPRKFLKSYQRLGPLPPFPHDKKNYFIGEGS